MLLGVNAKEAVRSLYSSKQRTILALIGVIIGVGSVMAMLSVGETVKGESLQQFRLMGTDVIGISAGFAPAEPGAPHKETILTKQQFDRIARYSRYIRQMSPEVDAWGEIQAGPAQASKSIRGVSPEYAAINRLKLEKGRFVSFLDRGRPHVVLGSDVARELRQKGAAAPLEEILIKGRPYAVIGKLAPAQLGYRSSEVNGTVFVPLDTASRISSAEGLSKVTVRLWPWADHEEAGREIRKLYTLFSGSEVPLNIESPKQLLDQMDKQMRLFTLLLAAVGSISLVVGGVGIMNMMLVSVTERRREIGVRRAMGAQRGDIISQFLVESVILSLSGGVIGVVLGIAACLVISHFQSWKPIMPAGAVLLCLGVALAVGLFFGYYPARKAARMDVIAALKAD